jgi:hypothetical protein
VHFCKSKISAQTISKTQAALASFIIHHHYELVPSIKYWLELHLQTLFSPSISNGSLSCGSFKAPLSSFPLTFHHLQAFEAPVCTRINQNNTASSSSSNQVRFSTFLFA